MFALASRNFRNSQCLFLPGHILSVNANEPFAKIFSSVKPCDCTGTMFNPVNNVLAITQAAITDPIGQSAAMILMKSHRRTDYPESKTTPPVVCRIAGWETAVRGVGADLPPLMTV